MDSDQLRIGLILSVLIGATMGFFSFVFVSGVRGYTVPAERTATPTIILSPTQAQVPLLPSRRPATNTPRPTTSPTATLSPTNTPIPTHTLPQTPAATRTSPLNPTAVPPIETVNWVIVTGSYQVLQEALADRVRFQEAGYEITLFLRGDIFRSAIIGYPTIADARDPLEEVRLTLEADAYLRDLRVWCPERIQQSGYLACQP